MSDTPTDTTQTVNNIYNTTTLTKPDMVRTDTLSNLVTAPKLTNNIITSVDLNDIPRPVLKRSSPTSHMRVNHTETNSKNNKLMIDVMEEYILHEHK